MSFKLKHLKFIKKIILKIKKWISSPRFWVYLISLLFAAWLMTVTFGYDLKNREIIIAAKAWSDFGNHIPLIRSFSFGTNFPPEFPIFPGEPIRYHFLFYAFTGFLEKIGFPLSWALNLPSIIGFTALLILIYELSYLLFKKRSVAVLSAIFFLFNSSLSFLEYFKQNPLITTPNGILRTITTIMANNRFPSFGPYDGKVISAFWNMNIYTNQRHLAATFAIILAVTYILLKESGSPKLKIIHYFLLGLVVGFMPFFHSAGFMMLSVIIVMLFLFLRNKKNMLVLLVTVSLVALPQMLVLRNPENHYPIIHLGYLTASPITFKNFLTYWVYNLGLSSILIPLGFTVAPRKAKILFLAVLPLFLIGNLFQFSVEIAANHKFFSLFIIFGNIFSALLLVKLWESRFLVGKIFALLLVFFMTFSGVIDLFPIKNDGLLRIKDIPGNETASWIFKNTPKEAIFLNSSYFMHPASIAGRKIFLGWPYFPWSIGYNTYARDALMKKIWTESNKLSACSLLRHNRILYVVLEPESRDFPMNVAFWKNSFIPSYQNHEKTLFIFNVNSNCQ